MIPAYELHQEDSVSLATIQKQESQDSDMTSKEHEFLERSWKCRLHIYAQHISISSDSKWQESIMFF